MPELHFESRMSDSDSLMWNIEKDPLLRSTIIAVTMLDRAPDRDALLDRIERGSRLVPRMRQRVIGNVLSLAPPRWEYDLHFDLRCHLRWVNAGGDGTMGTVLDIAEPIAMQGFDRARPLWEFVVVEGLEDGRAAMIQKLHHAITDGVGGMQIAMLLLDLEREPAGDEEPMPPVPDGHVLSPAERTLDAVTHLARRNLGIARRARATVSRAAAGVVTHPLSTLRMNMPINVRNDDTQDEAGNQFAPARFPVPLDIDDPLERMRTVRDLVIGQRGEPSLALIEPMAGVLNRMPTTLTTAIFGSMLKGVDFTTSNVPGAPIPVFIGGAEITEMFAFGPLAGAAVNVTLLSHCDHAHIGVNSDLAAVPDPSVLHDCLRQSFDDVLQIA